MLPPGRFSLSCLRCSIPLYSNPGSDASAFFGFEEAYHFAAAISSFTLFAVMIRGSRLAAAFLSYFTSFVIPRKSGIPLDTSTIAYTNGRSRKTSRISISGM